MGSFWIDNMPGKPNTAPIVPSASSPQLPTGSDLSNPPTLPPNYHLPGGPNLNPQAPNLGPYQNDFTPRNSDGSLMTGPLVGSDPRVSTQPQPYQQGPGGTGPVVGGLMPDGSFNANPYNYDKSQGPFIPDSQLGIDPNSGHVMGGGQQPQGDPKSIALQYAQSLGPPSPENIQKTADYMKSLGYDVKANPGSDGFFLNGVGVDMVSNFKGGGQQNWQFLPDSPMGGGSLGNMGNPNDPAGFQTGTFTGGGKYPLASVMGTGLAQPWTTPFQAPDNLTEQNDPGFQARMKMGTDALQRSAASKGTLLTGGMLKGLDRYAQDYASNEYGNVYNRALGQYQQAYGIFNNNQGNLFNRLSTLGSVGEDAAAGVGNAMIGAGNAQGQGSISQGNIWGNAANQLGNVGLQYLNARQNQPPNQGTYIPGANGTTGVNIIQPDHG
jgi:hypothetical protein